MRPGVLLALSLSMGVLALAEGQTVTVAITSAQGNVAPRFEAGMRPSTLGWGPDDSAYPDRCVINPVDRAELVWVPAGTFPMGMSVEDRDRLWRENRWNNEWKYTVRDTVPVHAVTLTQPFWLCRYKVTVEQYAQFLKTAGATCRPVKETYRTFLRCPAGVPWGAAAAYAQWAGGGLLTEAQWEWSARGPAAPLFPWGNHWDDSQVNCAEYWAREPLCNYELYHRWFDVIPEATYPFYEGEVGAIPTNVSWCGARDMVGKNWEWCRDWADPGWYTRSPAVDPQGPTSGERRLVRGGNWCTFSHNCLTVYRTWYDPVKTQISFRLMIHP